MEEHRNFGFFAGAMSQCLMEDEQHITPPVESFKVSAEISTNASFRVLVRRPGGVRKPEVRYTCSPLRRTDQEWETALDTNSFKVLRNGGFEPPFEYLASLAPRDRKLQGIFCCRACDLPLFESKNGSGAVGGFPTFKRGLPNLVVEVLGQEGVRPRVELRCKCCGSFVGVSESTYVVSSIAIVRKELSPDQYSM
eukprot:CAMPEP_0185844862 /NCGR_PEP_ID=MMETSP1354-20130828/965_1 /TAXON_ID=708628 /ORGANISM="Erythrolobus madagascarensis, Strain CCMP3276" /LENGTH=194 /DNA_ID=CAMNT_0028544665 /DNA_START=153 /DNA_END=735 /DNA_ORIENTATION=+